MGKRLTLQQLENLKTAKGVTITVGAHKEVATPKSKETNAAFALGRMKAGVMNKTEQKYYDRLTMLKNEGDVLWFEFEPANLRLADSCFYKIDFLVMTKDLQMEVHEVKGYWTDDALVKIKVAAAKFPFRFIALQYKKKEWVVREF